MKDWATFPIRSLLFAPGSEPRKLKRLPTFGSDAIVVDLEDAVAEDQKTAARALTREAVQSYDTDAAVVVRMNGITTGRMEEDIEATVVPGVDAVIVPKIESLEMLGEIDAALAAAERRHELEPGSVGLLVLLETALGLVRCEQLLADGPERIVTAILGLGDFTTDLNVTLSPDFSEVLYARSRVVAAARAAGLAQPIDGPYLDLKDMDGLAEDSARSRRLGFQGRVVVYPPQVEHVLRAYGALAPEEVARLERLVEVFEQAEREGSASLRHEGEFVDYPIYYRAKEALVRHRALNPDEVSR
jgi:citrate lyase subunit beta/citryl-CoA lyase